VAAMLVMLIVGCLALTASSVAHADDAYVLPKGRTSVAVENKFFLPIEDRFGPNGKAEPLASAFDNRALDSSVFSILAPLNPLVGGRASIGDAHVNFTYHSDILSLTGAYGITDRLTVGVDIPYYWVRNDVKTEVNSGPGSSANVGLRTGPGLGPCALPVAVLPLACPNTRRFTTQDVQQILGPGLAGIPGFGFKPVKDFEANGIGDITVGAKYQYLRTEDWRLAVGAGVRFPTGRQDDPDDLSDVFWSTGAYALLARFHNDFILSNLWQPTPTPPGFPISRTGDVLLDFTFRFDWSLPDEVTIRTGPENSLPTSRARVTRDIGDKFEFELGGRYIIWSPLVISALYRYGFKLEDRVSGPPGFPQNFAEKDTNSTEQLFIVELAYSTVPAYLEGRFPIPINAWISYRDRFAGSGPAALGSPSQVLKARYIGVGLQIVF
jgi:Putative MetA-pathway of phenol degradation